MVLLKYHNLYKLHNYNYKYYLYSKYLAAVMHVYCKCQFTLNNVQLPSDCCNNLIKLAFISTVNHYVRSTVPPMETAIHTTTNGCVAKVQRRYEQLEK